jgi:hypothetical protein
MFIESNGLERYSYLDSSYKAEFSYPGEHLFFEFKLINEEKYLLAMSQPVRQGEGGIWCVDRYYFNGTGQLALPNTDLTMAEYYSAKQAAADEDPSKLQTPEEVAREYLEEVWGWTSGHFTSMTLTENNISANTNGHFSEFEATTNGEVVFVEYYGRTAIITDDTQLKMPYVITYGDVTDSEGDFTHIFNERQL